MLTYTINDEKLKKKDIDSFGKKVRAILLSQDKILVSEYGKVLLFPGGSVDKGEKPKEALIRELKEETGIIYKPSDLEFLFTLRYFQPRYPTRDNQLLNRLMITRYYVANFRGIDLSNTSRTQKEIKDGFHLELMSPEEILSYKSDNPRLGYFERENREVLLMLKRLR